MGLREEKPVPRRGIEGEGLRSRRGEEGDGHSPLLAGTLAVPSQLPLIRAQVITSTWVAATAQHPCHRPGPLPPWHPLRGGQRSAPLSILPRAAPAGQPRLWPRL